MFPSTTLLNRKNPTLWLCVLTLCSGPAALGQPQEAAQVAAASADQPASAQRTAGSICGSVADRSGALVRGATVKVKQDDASPGREAVTDEDGRFCVTSVSPGSFHLTVTLPGFAPQTVSGILHSGERYSAPPIVLEVAPTSAEVHVSPSQEEIAQDEIKAQEKQRALGIIPNFYVSYVPNAAPLTSKQKFELAWKTAIDPVTFAINGGSAGLQQAANSPSG